MKSYIFLMMVAHIAYEASALDCYVCHSGEEHLDCGPSPKDKFIERCQSSSDTCILGIFEYKKTKEIRFVRQCGERQESEKLCEGDDDTKVWGCNICEEDNCNGDSSRKILNSAFDIRPTIGAIFAFTALMLTIL